MEYEMKRGDIYYADLSGTIGCEQGGIRPVVIIQNNTGNTFSPTTIVAPLTSKQKKALPTHVYLRRAEKSGLHKESLISMEQIRTIDKSRIKGYIGKADDNTVQQINRAIMISLGLTERKAL